MKNRRSVMSVSALLIVFFHLWIYLLGRNPIEMFMRQTAYIGVDMFFFLSAYAISTREVTNYGAFLVSRLKSVYLKFLSFAVVAFFYAKWKLPYLLKVVSGVDLFEKGGGAFLWFLPAIMIFYLVLPLYQKLDKKNRALAIALAAILWFGVGLAVTMLTDYKAMFIFWNRIPVIFVGFYAAKLLENPKIKVKGWQKLLAGVIFLTLGSVLMYKCGYQIRLQKPLVDMFYVAAIPSAVGLILLCDFIPECKLIKWIGSATLEMYAVQMIFGYNFCGYLVKTMRNLIGKENLKNPTIAFWNTLGMNVAAFLFVIVIAVVISQVYSAVLKALTKKKK